MVEISNQDFEEMLSSRAKYMMLMKACLEALDYRTYSDDLQLSTKGEGLVITVLKFIEPERYQVVADKLAEKKAKELEEKEKKDE